jgi:hypothetical protein
MARQDVSRGLRSCRWFCELSYPEPSRPGFWVGVQWETESGFEPSSFSEDSMEPWSRLGAKAWLKQLLYIFPFMSSLSPHDRFRTMKHQCFNQRSCTMPDTGWIDWGPVDLLKSRPIQHLVCGKPLLHSLIKMAGSAQSQRL